MASEDTINLDFIKKLMSSEEPVEDEQIAEKNEKPAEPAIFEEVVPEVNLRQEDEQPDEKKEKETVKILAVLAKTAIVLVCLAMTAVLLGSVVLVLGGGSASAAAASANVTIMDKFDMFMTNQISSALEGVLNIEKVYWLSDSDQVAPEPNPDNYGTADSASELGWLLEEAANLIGGQDMLFTTDTEIWTEDKIYYYYDETILVITWKEVIDNCTYTFSEVKIAHPSQFRRFLAGGEFGSDKQYVTTEMATSVNAVVASSGDFYKYRRDGVVVYESAIQRFEGRNADSCYINDEGDLLFSYRNEIPDEAAARKFVEDNRIRFSLVFGPVLVDNGVECVPGSYPMGEINGYYSRMALCQRDKLHYLLINSTAERDTQKRHTVKHFAQIIAEKGCQKAYALDGGQTTVITMDDRYINDVDFGFQRKISDIIYFATALPDGE